MTSVRGMESGELAGLYPPDNLASSAKQAAKILGYG